MMDFQTFAFIIAGLTAFMLVFPPIALIGICAGVFSSGSLIAAIAGGVGACVVLFALVYTGWFHLEMGRVPSREGIWAYFLAAMFSGAAWAFVVRKFVERRAASGGLA